MTLSDAGGRRHGSDGRNGAKKKNAVGIFDFLPVALEVSCVDQREYAIMPGIVDVLVGELGP